MDNSGTIDYGEFIAATIHLNKLEREEHLVAAFRYFDKDGSGYITIDELQQACVEHNMTDVFLEDVIKEVDQDNVSQLKPPRRNIPTFISLNRKLVFRKSTLACQGTKEDLTETLQINV